MKRASIDIGSNTVLLLIAELSSEGKILKELENESRVTSLGKNLDKEKIFDKQSMIDTVSAIKEYRKLCDERGITFDHLTVTATEAFRVAKNANEFSSELESILGTKIYIINGEGEAYYTSLGVVNGASLKKDEIIIMDIGGASTELIKVQVSPFKLIETISLPLGAVRCSDWMREKIIDKKVDKILENFNLTPYKTKHLLCVAGSMTSLAGMIKGLKVYRGEEVNNFKITIEDFLKFSDQIKEKPTEDLLKEYPFLGKRSKSIQGGRFIGELISNKLEIELFEVSTLGLRYGTILSGGIDGRFCESI